MGWKKFFLGVGVGFASALILKETLLEQQTVSAEKALKKVKEAFKQNGPISGSWIQMNPEKYTKSSITYNVYKGGVSRSKEGTLHQYEFIVDASNGTILDVTPI